MTWGVDCIKFPVKFSHPPLNHVITFKHRNIVLQTSEVVKYLQYYIEYEAYYCLHVNFLKQCISRANVFFIGSDDIIISKVNRVIANGSRLYK